MRASVRSITGFVAAVSLLAAACGSDGGSSDTESPIPGATTPSSLPEAAAGAGTLVVDGVTYEFDVNTCRFGTADGAERGVPVELFALEGTGIGPGEEPLEVTVTRVFAKGDTDTFTDSIVLRQPGLNFLVQADRSESDGLVIDLRDPTATIPLLKLGDQHVTGSGTFGSRGSTVDDPTLPGTLAAGCP
ncbi:MAG TPA: hypothetical protein VMW08_09135 [Acidimicrobiales bacterium]|nr:hypothetical protein [Acidimicrobiales bacterium]